MVGKYPSPPQSVSLWSHTRHKYCPEHRPQPDCLPRYWLPSKHRHVSWNFLQQTNTSSQTNTYWRNVPTGQSSSLIGQSHHHLTRHCLLIGQLENPQVDWDRGNFARIITPRYNIGVPSTMYLWTSWNCTVTLRESNFFVSKNYHYLLKYYKELPNVGLEFAKYIMFWPLD